MLTHKEAAKQSKSESEDGGKSKHSVTSGKELSLFQIKWDRLVSFIYYGDL